MAFKIQAESNGVRPNELDMNSSLKGKVLEWKWRLPYISYWNLKNGDETLASVRESKLGCPNFYFEAYFDEEIIEIKLQNPEFVNYHPTYKKKHSQDEIVTYSIKSVNYGNGSRKVEEKREIGRLEHKFGHFLSPSKFILNNYAEYFIELSFQDKSNREYLIKSNENKVGSRVIAMASRSKIYPEWRAPIPGTFKLLDFREGDPNMVLIAAISFAFAEIVRREFDGGY